ncbi:MAG: hypothetical protein H0S85_03030 [Desulfovibrionaceae bacterium]|jgi:hypothetical protein|nr:hypothetical protein [Desulfovibrionaceae bacterium]
MSDQRPPEEASQEIVRQARLLVEEAEKRVGRHQEMLTKLGVSEDQVRNYLKRHDVPPGNQQLVNLQMRNIDDEARRQLREARNEGRKPRGMGRRGAIRI